MAGVALSARTISPQQTKCSGGALLTHEGQSAIGPDGARLCRGEALEVGESSPVRPATRFPVADGGWALWRLRITLSHLLAQDDVARS